VPDQNLAVVAAANAAVPLRPFVDQIMDWAAKRAAESPTDGAAQPAKSNQP